MKTKIFLSFFFLSLLTFSFAQAVTFPHDTEGNLGTGLFSYFQLEGNANDCVGNDNGIITNPILFGTQYGKLNQGAYRVDSGRGGITLNAPIPTSTTESINFWAYLNSSSTNGSIYLANSGATEFVYAGAAGGSGERIRFYDGSSDQDISTLLPNNNWYNITINFTTSTWSDYILSTATGTISLSGTYSGGPIGWNQILPSEANSSVLQMDEIGLWNGQLLDTTNSTDLYNANAGQTPSCSGGGGGKSDGFFCLSLCEFRQSGFSKMGLECFNHAEL